MEPFDAFAGGCACGQLRYRLVECPLIVQACHCHHCQRESGSAFAHNLLIERTALEILRGQPQFVDVPTASGLGQRIARCPHCHVALWSDYGVSQPGIAFVRVGTLDTPEAFPPDVHIFVATKQAWLDLPEDVPTFPAFYDLGQTWPADSLRRLARLQGA